MPKIQHTPSSLGEARFQYTMFQLLMFMKCLQVPSNLDFYLFSNELFSFKYYIYLALRVEKKPLVIGLNETWH